MTQADVARRVTESGLHCSQYNVSAVMTAANPQPPPKPKPRAEVVKPPAIESMLSDVVKRMKSDGIERISVEADGKVNIVTNSTFQL